MFRKAQRVFASPWLLCCALLAAILVTYRPAWNGKPVWDDDAHMTKAELQSAAGLARIWTDPGSTQQYYPLVYSIFWVEHRIWADRPLPYHLVNMVLHGVSAFLLALILRRLQIPGAALAAGIFALHPIQVESVAWISELKNTLSGALYFGSALGYIAFDQTRRLRYYVIALVLFLLALMCKTVVATLPAALLVVLWWKRGRLRWKEDVLILAPFFAAGVGAGLFTAWAEKNLVGAHGHEFDFSIVERCLIAGRAFWFYLGKLAWPVGLMFVYPRWHIDASAAWQYAFPAAAAGLVLVLVVLARRNRAPLAAVLLFGGTLFPALGFLNVYPFRFSFVADHFQYLACAGVIALAAAGAARRMQREHSGARMAATALSLGVLVALACLSRQQSTDYADEETLWNRTLARNSETWLGQYNLGTLLARQNRTQEALPHFEKAMQIRPDLFIIQYNYGSTLLHAGKTEDAVARLQEAIRIEPHNSLAEKKLGDALMRLGRVTEALTHYDAAVRSDPDFAEAQSCFAYALSLAQQPAAAALHYKRALTLRRDNAQDWTNLGITLSQLEQCHDAVECFVQALRLDPRNLQATRGLAWLLATCPDAAVRNGTAACTLAEEADRMSNGNNPVISMTLAAAYAEAGRFEEAISTAERGAHQAEVQQNQALAKTIEVQLALYRSHRPYRDLSDANLTPANPATARP